MNWRAILFGLAAIFAGAICARGQTVYTWTGATDDYSTSTGDNWLNGIAPVDDLVNTQLVFGTAHNTHARYYQIYVNQILISGSQSYWIEGDYDTTHIGAGGIVYSPSSPVTSRLDGRIMLEASQTWDIQSGTLIVDSNIDDNGNNFILTKAGAGTLVLGDYSNWTGGFTLSAGNVVAQGYNDGSVWSFGTGTFVFNGGTLVTSRGSDPSYYGDVVTLENPIVSNGLIRTINYIPLYFSPNSSNVVTLNADTTIDTSGEPLFIESNIVESTGPFRLTVNGSGVVVLTGTNSYTGGTDVTNGRLIFGALTALPATPGANALTSSVNGYIGIGDDGTSGMYNAQTAFVDRFNKAATFGTIGFDTDPNQSATNFADPISLVGFASSAKLGSATHAILSGNITPQGTDYRFGGGGGFLQVDSQLTGARNLVVDSLAAYPLTLRLTAFNNDFTGTMSVTNSALVFADTALPSGSRNISIGVGGYVGSETANSGSPSPDDSDIAFFLGHIGLAAQGMIGFDATPDSSRTLSRDINLSAFTGPLYLGTATTGYAEDGIEPGTVLSGVITTTNGGTDPYRFAGYKAGVLEVDSTLSGSAGIVIGDPNSPATMGDPTTGTYSTVYLTGNNTALSGNILLYAGKLGIGQSNGIVGTDPTNVLGSGTLIVQPTTLPTTWTTLGVITTPALTNQDTDLILPNAVILNTNLRIGVYSYNMNLTGQVSGTGGFYLDEDSELTLSNNTNSFSGGIYLSNYSTLNLNANNASGSGLISFGYSGGDVYFDTLTPVINGLSSNNSTDFGTLYATLTDTVLTINQAVDTEFQGAFRSDLYPNDNFRIVKSGAGTLNFRDGGFYFYNGTIEPTLPSSPQIGLQVNQGTLILGQNVYFENSTPGVWVHGGTLALDNNTNLQNNVYVDNGGRLQGSGTIYASTIFFSSSILSPGVAGSTQVGSLGFDELTLMGGARMEITIRDPNGSAGTGWDMVYMNEANPLHIDASVTVATPFTLRLVTVAPNGSPGTAVGFLNQTYTWTIFDASYSSIDFSGGSFNPAVFVIDTSAFNADIGPGNFSFTQTGNLLQINFQPVPEPSTYALLALGLGAMALRFRRRS